MKTQKTLVVTACAACAIFFSLTPALQAQYITFNIDAEVLADLNGNPMPVTGLVMLIASTLDSSFAAPLPGAFVSGDDIILKKWDLSAWEEPGVFQDTTGPLKVEGDWNTGDPLALMWWPTLTLASTAPAAGDLYGFFRSDLILDGSDIAWITPTAPSTKALKFFTENAWFLPEPDGGSNPEIAGRAVNVVIPEPSVGMLIGMGLVGFLMIRRRSGRK